MNDDYDDAGVDLLRETEENYETLQSANCETYW
jgi:hypothetical protein